MPVFKIFNDNNIIEQRVYSSIDDDKYVIVHNLHLLHNDIIDDTYNLISRTRDTYPGLLKLNSNSYIGRNKRGLLIYQFMPLDKHLPIFYVASSDTSRINKYAVVKFLKWDSSSSYPTGQIEILFESTDYYKAYLIHYNLHYKALPYIIRDHNQLNVYSDFHKIPIISIDPEGCTDIDDAISYYVYTENEYNKIKISVYIADVDKLIPKDSELDLQIKSRGTSIYLNHKKINMIPDKLADELCSLKAGTYRSVIQTDFIYTADSDKYYQLEKFEVQFKITDVCISANLTYEQSENTPIIKFLTKFLQVSNSHQVIEKLMVQTNHEISKFLKRNGNLSLERVHIGTLPSSSLNVHIGTLPSSSLNVHIGTLPSSSLNVHIGTLPSSSLNVPIGTLPSSSLNVPIGTLPSSSLNVHIGTLPSSSLNVPIGTLPSSSLNVHSKTSEPSESTLIGQYIFDYSKLQIADTAFQNFILFHESPSAEYSACKSGHESLKLSSYCHFTSPIRRYADLITHRLVKNILNSSITLNHNKAPCYIQSELNTIATELNQINKNVRRFMNKYHKIELRNQDKLAGYILNHEMDYNNNRIINKLNCYVNNVLIRIKLPDIYCITYQDTKLFINDIEILPIKYKFMYSRDKIIWLAEPAD